MPTELIERRRPSRGQTAGAAGRGHGFNGDGARPSGAPSPARTALFGLAAALAAIAMLFVAFTTTYLGHHQDATWVPVPLPGTLWLDTALLLASSVTLERGRRRLMHGDLAGLRSGLTAAGALGLAFLLGQLLAWQYLARAGVYLGSNPHSSFFYLLTGAHGVHLLGGLVALAVIVPRAWRAAYAPPAATAVDATAIYWHFLTALWLYLFVLLYWL
jgi:cytochrome c oxidase subunit III